MTTHETDHPSDLDEVERNDEVDASDEEQSETAWSRSDDGAVYSGGPELPASDEDTEVDDHEVLAGGVQDDDVPDDGDDDESVLLTESAQGSVLPPGDEVSDEPEATEVNEAPEPSAIERLEPVGPDTPMDPGSGSNQERWSAIQSGFIDDPSRAVESASALLLEMWDAIERSIVDERHAVDSRWQGSKCSTDELRVAMQDYRNHYARLTNFTSS